MKSLFRKLQFLIVTIIIGCCVVSCSFKAPSQADIIRKNVEAYLKENMNDPDSYEFVSLMLIDSVLYQDNVNYRKNMFGEYAQFAQDLLEQSNKRFEEFADIYYEEEIEKYKAEISRNELIIEKIDSIANGLGERLNEVASYTYLFKFRGNNAFGSKILNECYLQTDPAPEFNIINLTDDKDKIFLNPNDFPGYHEMIQKELN